MGGGGLGDNVHEGGPAHVEGLDSLFVIPGVYLEVVPEHLIIHGILGGLVLLSHVELSSKAQDTLWAQGTVGDPV